MIYCIAGYGTQSRNPVLTCHLEEVVFLLNGLSFLVLLRCLSTVWLLKFITSTVSIHVLWSILSVCGISILYRTKGWVFHLSSLGQWRILEICCIIIIYEYWSLMFSELHQVSLSVSASPFSMNSSVDICTSQVDTFLSILVHLCLIFSAK